MTKPGDPALAGPTGSRTDATQWLRRVAVKVIVCLTVVFAILAAAGAAGPDTRQARQAPTPRVWRRRVPAVDSPCDHPRPGPLVYGWPVRPFRRQHPIRGFFGDPRTVGLERLGFDKAGSLGSFAFHNGIDITAAPGTPVYPVVSGIAHVGTRDRISVTTGDGRTFQYFHLERAVRPGEPVIAHRTVLGTVKPIWNHLHLTEIDAFKAHNPLDPGHLEPYRDRTVPTIDRVSFTSSSGLELDPSRLHGVIEIVADAEDLPPLPVPGHWLGFPVAPALVTWRLTSTHGRTLLRGVAADFRHTEPPPSDFWHVYAAGTYQNYPDFTHHLYWHVPGRYLFNLTQSSLDTRRFRNGTYLVSVGAADTCGNRSILTEQIRIDNQRSRLRSNAQQLTSASQP